VQIILTLCETLLYSQQYFHISGIIFKFLITTLQYKSKRFRDNIFVHIHECLVSRQAVFLNIKLISIITADILSHDQFQWKPNS
jgi:hypothetical protein